MSGDPGRAHEQKAHKGTDKWFALGDELDHEHPPLEQPLWQRHRMRIALVIAVGVVLIVATAVVTGLRSPPAAAPATATAAQPR